MTKDEKKKLVEEISSSFYNSIRGNSKIQRIITDGAASSEEVAKLAKQLGAYLRSAVVHGFTDIELLEGEEMSELAKEILEPLMKYSHELVGKAAKDVYTAFNEENNIDINPKLPDFPKARFDQIISAAGEEGKPRETILRRISVVPETVVTNMSDQNARAAANTYSSAGFETYIQRSDGAGCCNWCSKLVGKFEYPENTPKDVFRRHDNCGCIVTYVCGNMRQNVHSRETWEQPDVTVPELVRSPDVNVPELVKKPLTSRNESDIINKKDPLSSFLNSSEQLYENAKKIKPLPDYQDIVIHGDKTGFSYKDKDGNETYLNVGEFTKILKESGLYKGGKIRLISCETAAEGAHTAQWFANDMGVEVLAPNDIVWVDRDGNMTIGPDEFTNSGAWIPIFPEGVSV